ncbi:RNA helicase [Mycena chlorophos]|uniref:ATP-dependent RNA helicase n=1 Tax=Mycena chlorophos TaxID=658473 RepID=A0A8H6SY55_MYCCL|nr:RNA helicase [Mycena chlorophos]
MSRTWRHGFGDVVVLELVDLSVVVVRNAHVVKERNEARWEPEAREWIPCDGPVKISRMDDDLVLNIASDTGPLKHATAAKGGRWTDRLKAKRVEKRKSKSKPSKHAPDEDARPAKRPRLDPEATAQKPKQKAVAEQPIAAAARKPQQVISSLFSYNPKIDAPAENPAPVPSSKRPSNAPLADSSDFAGLGLDPLISAHLVNKMSISTPTAIQRAVIPSVNSPDSIARDVFIQSQTGSGKTLSFLLPIIQDLLPLSSLSYIDRTIGTLAIIIAPTRELAKQISDVLEALLQLRLRPEDESADESGPRLTRWLVSGLLTGGGTRSHEKARLRKGLPIIVATPGRLLDHLQNTGSLNVGKCRWLVLDEADRLMELGFEETITGIIQGLDGRHKLARQAVEAGKSMEVGGWDWERRRRTILCSATIREDVQKLAGKALVNPMMIKATEAEPAIQDSTTISAAEVEKFTPPSQLAQKYVVVPLKLRLVALVSLLRNLISQSQNRRGTKIIVFLSCTDSVDFHWSLLGGASMGGADAAQENESGSDEEDEGDSSDEVDERPASDQVEVKSPLLPDTSIFRLHGSLPTPTLETVLRGGFGGKGTEYEARATEVQLSFERWVLGKKENASMARKAYLSHMRAYATHPSSEKHIFHIRHLHLGHLAKSFALRDAPKAVSSNATSHKDKDTNKHRDRRPKAAVSEDSPSKKRVTREWEADHTGEAEKRMQKVVRAQGRLSKKGGVMMSSGASEFQIAGGAALEALVGSRS